jgi:EmrB/QacA subfamily drug resistance transporter
MHFLANRWQKFCALIPAAALVYLDQTILPIALPSIQKEMQASGTALQWSVNAYLLAIAVFVLISGKLCDKIGHKKGLMWGIFGFVVCSIICSLSQTIELLIIARALQGLSAAFMYPAQTTMIALIFPPEKRGRATGMIASLGSLFLILGPLVGGYLIEAASWRWIFWINLPIGALGLWMISAFLPSSEPGKGKIDLSGFAFFGVGISALTVVFMQAADWGWTSPPTLMSAFIAVCASALLLYREKRVAHPFLNLSLFKHPTYAAININITTIQFILMITVFRTLYFQDILAYSPFQTGLIMFISSLPIVVAAPFAGYLSDRFSPRLPVALGYLFLIFSSFGFAFHSTPSFIGLIIVMLAFGLGIPFIFTPSYSSAMASVPQGQSGTAAGMITTLRMTGGTMGLALIHLLATVVKDRYLPIEGERLAEVTSFSFVHFALAFLLILAFSITFIFHSRKSGHHPPDAPAEGWD